MVFGGGIVVVGGRRIRVAGGSDCSGSVQTCSVRAQGVQDTYASGAVAVCDTGGGSVCGEGLGPLGCVGADTLRARISLCDAGAGGTSDFSALGRKGTAAASGMVRVAFVAGCGGDNRRRRWMGFVRNHACGSLAVSHGFAVY
jgi:hypothetical protein